MCRKEGMAWKEWQEKREKERELQEVKESDCGSGRKFNNPKPVKRVTGYITEQAPKLKKKKKAKLKLKVKVKKGRIRVGRRK